MVSDTVGHCLHENALLALDSAAARLAGRREDGESIVTVDTDSVQAVRRATGRDTVSCVLVDDGSGNGETVVAAEPDAGTTKNGVHVESGVEVTLGRSTVTEVAYDTVTLPGLVRLERVRRTRGLRKLGREGRRDSVEAEIRGGVVDWHHATLAAVVVDVAKALAHHTRERHSAVKERSLLTLSC